MRMPSSTPLLEIPEIQWSRIEKKLKHEEVGEYQSINICAYDNVLSETARRSLSSPLGFRYRLDSFDGSEPRIGARKGGLFYKGQPAIDELETLARQAALRMFSAADVDFRPLSGVHASLSTILAASELGDTLYSIDPKDGGHFATRTIAESSGRKSRYLIWDKEKMNLDLEASARLFDQHPPSLIFLDHGSPLFPLPLRQLRQRIGPNAKIIYDASHTLGLMAAGRFQKPLEEGCDILQGNTHKSFPGPQKAMLLFRDQNLSRHVKQKIDDGLISSQHTHSLMALCISLLEMEVYGSDYVEQMLLNTRLLGRSLMSKGHRIFQFSENSQTHILLVDLGPEQVLDMTGAEVFNRLLMAGFAANVRPMFGRTILRIGTQEITRRGYTSLEILQTSHLLHQAITAPARELAMIRAQVAGFARNYRDVHYSFDHHHFGRIS